MINNQLISFQTSLDPRTWFEFTEEAKRREALKEDSPEAEKRRLFPLSGVLVDSDPHHGLPAGQYFKFVRAKRTPSTHPFEALAWSTSGKVKVLEYTPEELQAGPVGMGGHG